MVVALTADESTHLVSATRPFDYRAHHVCFCVCCAMDRGGTAGGG